MKRIGKLFNNIVNFDNLVLADKKARAGKTKKYGIIRFDKNSHENLIKLQKALLEDTYRTSKYHIFTILLKDLLQMYLIALRKEEYIME